MSSMFTMTSTLHTGPVPEQFHHLKGPWARWLSLPSPEPQHTCSSQRTAHVSRLRGWVLGETEGRRGLSSMPPSTAAHCVRGQAYPSGSGPGLHQGVWHLSGRSHASDAYSSSDCRAVRGGGWRIHPGPQFAYCVGGQRAQRGISTNHQLTILRTIIHDAG